MTGGPGGPGGSGGPTLGTAATPAASRPSPVLSRRRAWLVFAALALLTAVYLVGWSSYAALHTRDRYEQRPPGAAASRGGAEFRLVGLTRSDQLADGTSGRTQDADPGAVFVVAVVEAVPRVAEPVTLCTVALLGPGGRIWTPDTVQVQRSVPSCSPDDAREGQPYRFEAVFQVPERDAGLLRGLALTDRSGVERSAVLRPPA